MPLKLEDYDISSTNGFLPTQAPLARLPDPYYEPWERIVDKFNQHMLAGRIRPLVDKMPVLDTGKLATMAEYQRAFTLLSFLAHAYVRGYNSAKTEGVSQTLPESISVPWVSVANILEMNPVICLASLCHWNWQHLDYMAKDMMDISNLGTQFTFTGSTDESWFYLIPTAIEAKGARGINAILHGIEGVRNNDIQQVTWALHDMSQSLQEMIAILQRMYERCDPHVFYWNFRKYMSGWNDADEFPHGLKYEDANDGQFFKFSGGSAAQTPLMQAFDVALGTRHYPTWRARLAELEAEPQPPPANSYLLSTRDYMPAGHRRFLEDLAAICMIREFWLLRTRMAIGRIALRQEYNQCVELMRGFRDKHIMIVSRYASAKGTGGTNAIQFLRQIRTETNQHRY
ncbi:Indoleamine 2,3-dioxygenase [Linderina pennispora]|uniref:Indoleamine 2,3-dioxygenase n=1 Tax=Linderina pennispora TaxID=61395 RepID=A0A1Y1WDF9_9FUNG|nr:Indoleamine 2,3-dioxygenase [Linderina pennispora]ORX71194.1 Indoleamine 2,3-dioxygenase [Linderina pennispora]